MNETIGSKGGKNDRRRTLIITKKQKEKLRAIENEKNKKDIKRKDINTFIKILPLIIIGNAYQTFKINSKKDNQEKEEKLTTKTQIKLSPKYFKEQNQTQIDKTNSTAQNKFNINNQNIEVKNEKTNKKRDSNNIRKEKLENKNIQEELIQNNEKRPIYEATYSINTQTKDKKVININSYNETSSNNNYNNSETFTNQNNARHNKTKEPIISLVPFPSKEKINKSKEKEIKRNSDKLKTETKQKLTDVNNKIEKLTNIKLIESYENELQDVRYELKKLIFEYKVLEEYSEKTFTTSDIEELLEKLNIIIKKIEELRKKLDIDNLSNYDDDYIRSLVNEYISILGTGQTVEGLEDSELYILLSSTLDKIEKEKDIFQESLQEQQNDIIDSEENLDNLKTEYLNIQKYNDRLEKFQQEQEALLKTLQEKIANSKTIEEKVEYQISFLNKQSKNLLKMLAFDMMIPDPITSKVAGAATLSYMYFMRRALKPKLQINKKRYKVITVEDFSRDILNTIENLNYTAENLNATSNKLQSMISEFKSEYKDYIDNVPEYSELLDNLIHINETLKEKEFEIRKIASEQKKNLQTNNEKVKVLEKSKELPEAS